MSDENRHGTPTSFLRDLKPPSYANLPDVRKPTMDEFERRGNVFVHFCWDKSGTFLPYAEPIGAFLSQFSRRCVEHGIAGDLQIAVTEMSGIAVSSPYKELGHFSPPNLRAGMGSPHGQFLAAARKVDAPLIGAPKTAMIRIIACDGISDDSQTVLDQELDWLAKAQREDRTFHVFVLKMGPTPREDILRRMSPMRPNFEAFDGNFDALLNQIFQLIAGTIEDPTVPARSMNLRDIARPEFKGRGGK